MCLPYLEDFHARILQHHDAVRSIRLILADFVISENEILNFLRTQDDSAEIIRAGNEYEDLETKKNSERLPNEFTVNQFLSRAIAIKEELASSMLVSSSWNGPTREMVKIEFSRFEKETQRLVKTLLQECASLVKVADSVGLDVERALVDWVVENVNGFRYESRVGVTNEYLKKLVQNSCRLSELKEKVAVLRQN
jgi:hypothetical protein